MLAFARSVLAAADTGTSSSGSSSPVETSTMIDYSDTLQQISQLIAYCDLLLVVLTILVFLGSGLFFGHLITRWMHGR